MKKRVIPILLFAVITAISCKSNSLALGERSVFAMFYDYDNCPINNVSFILDGKELGKSDVNGRFVFKIDDSKIHKVEFQREGYESIEDEFKYSDSLVLYYKMGNSDQYLKKAEERLDLNDYNEALKAVDKSLEINRNRDDALYLKAIVLYKLGRNDEAAEILDKMESKEINKKYIEGLLNENKK